VKRRKDQEQLQEMEKKITDKIPKVLETKKYHSQMEEN
jgi:hypothetical protein